MQILKYFLLGLLILISFTLIFCPGLGILEIFYLDLQTAPNNQLITFIHYPPALYYILKGLLLLFPVDSNIAHLSTQPVWLAYKILLYIGYLATGGAILFFSRFVQPKLKLSKLDISIAFFSCITFLHAALSLSYFEILAGPFLVLSLAFYFKKKYLQTILFFLLALSFNWSLLVLLPLLFWRSKKLSFFTSFAPLMLFLNQSTQDFHTIPNRIFSFILLLTQPSIFIKDASHYIPTADAYFLAVILEVIALITILIFFVLFFKRIFPKINSKKIFFGLIALTILSIGCLWTTNFTLLIITMFLLVYIPTIYLIRQHSLNSPTNFLTAGLCLYLSVILFIPETHPGNLIWPVLLGLLIYILKRSPLSYLQLFLLNLFSFINLFIYYGSSGTTPVNSAFFLFLNTVFLVIFLLSVQYLIAKYCKSHFSMQNSLLIPIKRVIILLFLLLLVSLIPASGTGDVVSYNDTAIVATTYLNPFYVYAQDKEMYPPLSTVIISFFANIQKLLFGPSEYFKISVKISIFCFYLLTLWAVLQFSKLGKLKTTLSTLDKVIIFVSLGSLIIQTEGFSDINIYLIPTFILSIIALFKKKYFLSGLLFAITATIKWQPLIILPLCIATLAPFGQKIEQSFKQVGLFLLGLIPFIIIILGLVIIQPQGSAAFYRTIDYMLNLSGFHLLSGQALNLNWIVTYFLHIFQPETFHSLEYYDGLNRQVASDYGPWIFRGLFFYLVALAVFASYWLLQKKDLLHFLYATFIIYFSHHMIDKSAHEKHLFYGVIFMLLIYLIKPTNSHRYLLILLDIMTIMNLIFFYGFTGSKDINRIVLGFDITILFSAYYLLFYFWILSKYLKTRTLEFN